MKKKFKLFATIASLCLAVAVMAVGVFAATTTTYTVNNSVSYNISTNAYCKIKVEYFAMTDGKATAGLNATATTGLSFSETSTVVEEYTTYELANGAYTFKADADNGCAVALDFTTSYAYKVVITVNDVQNTNGIKLNVTQNLTNTNNNWFIADANITDQTVAKGLNQSYTYYVGLVDTTIAIAESTSVGTVVVTVADI